MHQLMLFSGRTKRKNGGPKSVSHQFVGTDGITMKVATMDAIQNYDTLVGEGTILEGDFE